MIDESPVSRTMREYFGADKKRIDHALSVLGYAREIMTELRCDREIVTAAALLHDIGIHEAERKYHSNAGKYQEIEGPPIARGMLRELGWPDRGIAEVCAIIAHHHTPGVIRTDNFQAVFEADWLVNLRDDFKHLPESGRKKLVEQNIRTQAGRKIAAALGIITELYKDKQ